MDATSRVLISVGGSLQIAGVALTAVHLNRTRLLFAERAARRRQHLMEANEQGAVIALAAGLLELFLSARAGATKRLKVFASLTLAWSVWLLRRVHRQRRHIARHPTAAPLAINVSVASVVKRAPAPRFSADLGIDAQMDNLASFADGLSLRIDEERRVLEELLAAKNKGIADSLAAIDKDMDDLAVGGIRLGAFGVLFLIVGTALSLTAAWT